MFIPSEFKELPQTLGPCAVLFQKHTEKRHLARNKVIQNFVLSTIVNICRRLTLPQRCSLDDKFPKWCTNFNQLQTCSSNLLIRHNLRSGTNRDVPVTQVLKYIAAATSTSLLGFEKWKGLKKQLCDAASCNNAQDCTLHLHAPSNTSCNDGVSSCVRKELINDNQTKLQNFPLIWCVV